MIIKTNSIKLLLLTTLLSSCATNKYIKDHTDPLEPLNRGFFKFNKTVDKLYINPVSKTYELVLPKALRELISNFLSNIGEIPTIINSLLQTKYQQALHCTGRFTINSTLGIGGLFDVATKANLPHKQEDFGKTLATWGYKNSTYIVLPILGPSTIRDTVGFAGNTFLTVPYYLSPKWRNRYEAVYVIDKRSNLRQAESFINNIGVDDYKAVKDAFLQNRNYAINGNVISKDQALLNEPPE